MIFMFDLSEFGAWGPAHRIALKTTAATWELKVGTMMHSTIVEEELTMNELFRHSLSVSIAHRPNRNSIT